MEERYQFIFNYEDYFYQQACRFALQNDKEKSLSLLGRAVEHGFYKLEDFESAIKDSTIFSGIVEDMTYQKLKRSLYGDKHETGWILSAIGAVFYAKKYPEVTAATLRSGH